MLKKFLIVALTFLGNFLYCEEPNLPFYKETEHFRAFCVTEDRIAAESILQNLEQHFIKCSQDFHYLPKSSKKIRLNIYPDIQTFHSILKEKTLPHWKVCRYSSEDNTISLVNPENPGTANSKETVMKSARYGVGCFFMQEKCSFFPRWLALGFACYEANAYTKDQLRQYLLNDESKIIMPTFAQIDGQVSKKDFDSRAYPMAAYVYVEFLVTNWGWDKALAILENYADFENILQMSKGLFQEKCSQHCHDELKK